MSGILQVAFAPDVPVAAVEAVSPDFQVVGRSMLTAGGKSRFEVPSEQSFLRVHLRSGRVVTLHDPGNLDRVITRELLGLRAPRRDEQLMGFGLRATPTWQSIGNLGAIELVNGDIANVTSSDGTVEAARRDGTLRWSIRTAPDGRPGIFRLRMMDGVILSMALPPSVKTLTLDASVLHEPRRYVLSLESAAEIPDAMLDFMSRGDTYSAMAGESWIDQARDLVMGKERDPYSAAIGAYLLLRLGRTEKMENWAKNLADWFEFLPDGCVIWVWQMLRTGSARTDDVARYLNQAVMRGLPVFTEGVRLLVDGLQLVGARGEAGRKRVAQLAPEVIWNSPVTATLGVEAGAEPTSRPSVEIHFV